MSVEKIDFTYIKQEKKPFTTNLNSVIQNLKNPIALGLWVYLTSLPEGWIVNKEHLRKHFNIGRDKLDSVLLYLVQNSLIEVGQERLSDGKMSKGYINVRCGYEFKADCNEPEPTYPQKKPLTEKPLTAQPDTAKPGHGKSAPIKEIKSSINKKTAEKAPAEKRGLISDCFYPNRENQQLADQIGGKVGKSGAYLIAKFIEVMKKYKTQAPDFDVRFREFLLKELPSKGRGAITQQNGELRNAATYVN